jgi:ankyrin repeat protein
MEEGVISAQAAVVAIRSGDIETVQALYPPGCGHVDMVVGERKTTAVNRAALEGQLAILQYLISIGGDIDRVDEDNYNCAHLGAWYGYSDVLDYIGTIRPQLFRNTLTINHPIHIAAYRMHVAAIRSCAQFCDINVLNKNLMTPLRICIIKKEIDGVRACIEARARISPLDMSLDTSDEILLMLMREFHWRHRRVYLAFLSDDRLQQGSGLTRLPRGLLLEVTNYL